MKKEKQFFVPSIYRAHRSFILHRIGKFLLYLTGWKIEGTLPNVNRIVVVSAPHTSNWDFIFGMMILFGIDINAKYLIKKSAKNYKAGWITKGSGDSGIDFIGRMDIGTGFGSAKVIVLGQAKCESLNSPTGGNHIARTVAKLKRGWLGVYVTTSYFSDPAQIEILEDKYPLLLINGKKLAELVNEIVFDQGYKNVAEYLKKVDSEYEGVIQYRDPEEILFE